MNKTKATILFLVVIVAICSCKKEGTILDNKKAKWIENAFVSLESNNYPKVKAISWWHENLKILS